MVKSKQESKPFRAPFSGQVIGFVARRLGLEISRYNKNASRYFNGRQVSDRARNEIIASLARDLVEQGILPELTVPNYDGLQFADQLGHAIALHAGEWDSLVGEMRGASAPVDRPDLAGAAYLRLAAVDIAVRYAGLLCLTGLPAPSEGTPPWVSEHGGSWYLRDLMRRCGTDAPTRADLARTLGVWTNTVDGWLDSNVRPRSYHLDEIGEALAPCIDGMDAREVAGGLRLHYGLSDMCADLERHIGREAVVETFEAIVRLAARIHAELTSIGDPSVDIEAAILQLLAVTGGARIGLGPAVLRKVAEQESDPLWELEVVSATLPWDGRLRYVMKVLSNTGSVAKLIRDRYGIPEEVTEAGMDDTLCSIQAGPAIPRPLRPDAKLVRIKGDAEFSAANRLIQYEQSMALGDVETALVHMRRAVELQPENARHHLLLGAALAEAGETEEALQECWTADSLNPEDELASVEIGIILMNVDRNREALDHLERVALGQEEMSAHLSFNLGVARFRCGDYRRAQLALKRSLSLRGDYGPALDVAAQCAFEMGDTAEGRSLAKKARRHGTTEAYEKWKAKHYRKGRRSGIGDSRRKE